jgi:AcrR family transcriptional regulator
LNGYKNTSINNIIDNLWISKWAFFHYFKDKKSLFSGVMDYFFYESAPKEFYEILWKEVAEKSDIINLCKILHWEFEENNFKWWCLLWNMSLELSDVDEYFRTKLQELFIMWENWIIEHINKIPNFIPKKSPETIAKFIIFSMEWINLTAKVYKNKKIDKQNFDLFLEVLEGML